MGPALRAEIGDREATVASVTAQEGKQGQQAQWKDKGSW